MLWAVRVAEGFEISLGSCHIERAAGEAVKLREVEDIPREFGGPGKPLSGLRAWLALAESSQGDKQQSGACDDGYAAKFGQPYAMASILGHIEFPLYSRNVRGSPRGRPIITSIRDLQTMNIWIKGDFNVTAPGAKMAGKLLGP